MSGPVYQLFRVRLAPGGGEPGLDRDALTDAHALPYVTNLDLLSKILTISERVRLQARFEAFNSTNTPPFTTAPNATVGTNSFGQKTAAGAPRQLQFGLKALF
jgi:hypothetical protein